MKLKWIALSFAMAFSSCTFANQATLVIQSQSGPVNIQATVAHTEAEREAGLMHRKALDEHEGMLFVFDTAQPLTFWMKNTLIPLDILFIDSSKKIVDIQTMQPCKEDPCTLYPSAKPAQFALEINAGLSHKEKIQVGDEVIFGQLR